MHTQPVLRTLHVRHGFCLRRQLRLPAQPSASLFLGRSTEKLPAIPSLLRQVLEFTAHKAMSTAGLYWPCRLARGFIERSPLS